MSNKGVDEEDWMQPTDFFTGDRVFVFFVPNVMKVKLIDNCPKTS